MFKVSRPQQLALLILLSLAVFVSFGVYTYKLGYRAGLRQREPLIVESSPEASTSRTKINVHVTGAVKKPGLYQLARKSCVGDAIHQAGVISQEADLEQLNLAGHLKDGDRVFVPYKLKVEVCGAVKRPGVYKFSAKDRVVDAIHMAGGLTSQGTTEQLNLAESLEDGERVYVPKKGEILRLASRSSVFTKSAQGTLKLGTKININTATIQQLDMLPGIGPALAKRIIEYRRTHGLFRSIEEIKEVKGIGDKKYEKLKEFIKID